MEWLVRSASGRESPPVAASQPVLYTYLVTTCYIVIFRISKPNPDPTRRI